MGAFGGGDVVVNRFTSFVSDTVTGFLSTAYLVGVVAVIFDVGDVMVTSFVVVAVSGTITFFLSI